MATRLKPAILDTVAAALPRDAGLTPRQLNARLPDLTRRTVCDALLLLVRAGRARAQGEITKRRYFAEAEAGEAFTEAN